MQSASQSPARAPEIVEEAITTVRRWVDESTDAVTPPAPRRLAQIVDDPEGLAFAIAFVDRVIRQENVGVAARSFERLSRDVPAVMPPLQRILFQLGGGFAVVAPRPVVPIARAAFRRMVAHLVIAAEPKRLDTQLATLREPGIRLSLLPLGTRALGSDEADRRLAALMDLLGRDDVDAVTVRLSEVAPPPQPWAHEESVERIVERLVPLYEFAANAPSTKRITLDVEDPERLDLVVDVFTGLLERSALAGYEGGITLPASAPNAMATLHRLTDWATERRAEGGAGIAVRFVDGDSGLARLLDWALTPQRTAAVRMVVAVHNLFDLGFAWRLADARGVGERLEIERMLGVDTAQTEAVRRHVGGVLLSTPVVSTGEFAAASAHLVARFDERSRDSSSPDATRFDRGATRLRRVVAALDAPPPTQEPGDAAGDRPGIDPSGFDPSGTDPSSAAGRLWARRILVRARASSVGTALLDDAAVRDLEALDSVVENAVAAGTGWGATPGADRVVAVREFALVLDAMRGRLVEVLVSEIAATFAEADAEAGRAIALARRAADLAAELDLIENAAFAPVPVVLVAPGWTDPVADTVEAVAAAVAAGSAVIVQPAHQARRSAALVVEALREAGVPEGLVTLVLPEDAAIAKAAVAHPGVDRVLFTGDRDTAMLLRSWRPDRPPLGDVRGVASVIVGESADHDLAVADIVHGAFAHGGQHPHGARLVILVGAVAASEPFRRRLADAVRATHPASTLEASARIGPLIATPPERVRRLLSHTDGDETWLVQPEAMDDRLTVWRPGARVGVAAESAIQRTVAAPAIVLTSVPDLAAAVALQNAGRGETAGLHTRDIDELAAWLDSADAGALFVNRTTAGAAAGSLPVGGWHGAGGARGGADRPIALGDWAPVFAEAQQSVRLDGIGDRVRTVIEAAQPSMQFLEFDLVRAGAMSDERAWVAHYRDAVDLTTPGHQRAVVRHLPVTTTIRLSEGVSSAQLVRVLAAATRAGAPLHISTAAPVPDELVGLFGNPLSPLRVESVLVESEARWHARVQSGDVATPHIRLIGGDAGVLATVLAKRPDVALFAGPVTTSGRLELLPFLRAQVVSMAAQRYGLPDPVIGEIEF